MNIITHKKISRSFLYPDNLEEARRIQERLEKRVIIRPLPKVPRYVAGADAAFTGDKVIGVVALFSLPELEPIEERSATAPTPFPYRTGFLSFREGPILHEVLLSLEKRPDVVLIDGQGIAHPRSFGLACHMGLFLDLPSIGCAKEKLVGDFGEVGLQRGSIIPLRRGVKTIGAVVRTKRGVKPVFVSPGHHIDLETSIQLVLGTCSGFRVPEPLRRAHLMVKNIQSREEEMR